MSAGRKIALFGVLGALSWAVSWPDTFWALPLWAKLSAVLTYAAAGDYGMNMGLVSGIFARRHKSN
ncbi:hypothetical protein AA13594_2228 [Gluconacetobacter azotocaptans DSM 13594]|nr:hypothetical protein AA13594_2228 [Gluconacetobacter azotocaptans DSM 13594]